MKVCNKLLTFILTITFVLMTSCGEVGEGPGPESQVPALLTCSLDDEPGFDLIFEQVITSTWNCLDQSMDVFIRYVETEYDGYLSLDLLFKYIDYEKPEMLDDKPTIEQFFKLATLIVGVPDFVLKKWPDNGTPENRKEWHKFISKADIHKIIGFLKTFNLNVVDLKREFESDSSASYDVHLELKEKVTQKANNIAVALKSVFNKQSDDDFKLDLHAFIDTFINDENRDDLEMVKSFIFIKKIFLGGKDKHIISNTELSELVDHFSEYISISYDFTRFKNVRFDKKHKKYDLYEKDLTQLESLFFYRRISEVEMFSVDDILKAASHFKDELGGINLADHKQSILNLMDIVFNVNYKNTTEEERKRDATQIRKKQEEVTMSKFMELVDHFHNIFKKGIVFYEVYSKYRDKLNQTVRLSMSFEDYKPKLDYEIENLVIFRDITHQFRFFQEGTSPYYIKGYSRNEDAYFQIGVLKYAFKHVFEFIENKYPCDKEEFDDNKCRNPSTRKPLPEDFDATMTLRQMERLILEIKSILVELKIIIPEREATSANNATLMTDLFQFQSNGSGRVQENEATEFAVSVFSALDMGDIVLDKLRNACTGEWEYNPEEYPECIVKEDDGTYSDKNCEIQIEVPCFRRNFFKVLFTDWIDEDGKTKNFKDNLPLLHEYLFDELTPNQQLDFVIQTELFARTCFPMNTAPGKDDPPIHHWVKTPKGEAPMDLPDVPMGKGDMLSVLGGLLNIESTLLRFDTDEREDEDQRTLGNFNNRLDANEVDRAFDEVYRPAIEGLVRPILGTGKLAWKIGNLAAKYLSKTIFQYLIKHGKVPGMLPLAKFLVLDHKKKQPATRHTIAIILKTIAEKMGELCDDGEPVDLGKKLKKEKKAGCDIFDPLPLNPDKCPCTIKHRREEVRLKHCYPDTFPPANI